MLRTSEMLTITVPKPVYRRIRREAARRKSTISGLIRASFEYFTQAGPEVYSDEELSSLLKRDQLPKKLRSELDRLRA